MLRETVNIMKTIILAGGLGTRLSEETALKPKPMVEIGEHPILWHIMKIYAAYGMTDFILPLGYKGDVIKRYFLDYHALNRDFTIRLKGGQITFHDSEIEDWSVQLVDTGLNTMTGGRLKRLAAHLGGETFCMTYGDGVSNVDIQALVAFHRAQGCLATVTAVRPPARFGGLAFEGDRVVEFVEKPQIGEGWINGGFFVLEPAVLDYIDSDDTIFERDPLERLARDNQLSAYRHEGFWQSMDTLRDVKYLNSLWETGQALWKVWT